MSKEAYQCAELLQDVKVMSEIAKGPAQSKRDKFGVQEGRYV
jgi:hypothetical protein